MNKTVFALACISFLYITACSNPSKKDRDKLGAVDFPVSCNEQAIPHMERGLALLHHMTYVRAENEFINASQADPECSLSYWGRAMTYIHPLWSDPPGENKFNKALELINIAKTKGEKTSWENAYIAALEAYFEPGWSQAETDNLAGFERGWKQTYEAYPQDVEAASFYALAHLGTADPSDKSYAHQKEAGSIMEKVLGKVPDHPAGHHYAIHAYDYPALAENALEIARSYGKIAPDVPHALHMPTHIFTRLGLWDESISWNKRSAASALKHPAGEAISLHYLHALDYLTYAYLQKGMDENASQVRDTLLALEGPFQVEVATPYTFAAIPARIALERQNWSEAVSLQPRTPADYPWDKFPAMEAISWFAKGLGAVHTGNGDTATETLEQLELLENRAMKTSKYWAQQVEIQRLSIMAWMAYNRGEKQKGLGIMQEAADLEASTEKHPVTPGEILPASELLGDMLLANSQYLKALSAYEKSLERSPNRLNGLNGAMRAAELAGLENEKESYRKKLSMLTADADPGTANLE